MPRIVSHDYEETFTLSPTKKTSAKITFVPANHCPGAAVVLYTTCDRPDVLNVHCGDMRWTESITVAIKRACKESKCTVGTGEAVHERCL